MDPNTIHDAVCDLAAIYWSHGYENSQYEDDLAAFGYSCICVSNYYDDFHKECQNLTPGMFNFYWNNSVLFCEYSCQCGYTVHHVCCETAVCVFYPTDGLHDKIIDFDSNDFNDIYYQNIGRKDFSSVQNNMKVSVHDLINADDYVYVPSDSSDYYSSDDESDESILSSESDS